MSYATRSDVYRYGLPRGMLANPGRLCAAVRAASDTFELDEHGFETDDPLVFRAAAGGSLPPEIVAGVTHYAIRVTPATFKVAATLSGPAINLSVDGVSVLVATPLPFAEVLEYYSRFVDAFLPAHAVPLVEPYPVTVTAIVAELAAKKLLLMAGQSSASMTEAELAAKAQLERWAKATPLRDARATASTNLAYSESVATEPRTWSGRGGGFLP